MRFAHVDAHRTVVQHLRTDDSSTGVQFKFTAGGEFVFADVQPDAAGRVAAHFGFGAVGVVDAHFKGAAAEGTDGHHAVRADSEMAVAQMLRAPPEIEAGILLRFNDHEIVAQPVPLGKLHGQFPP